MIKVTRVRLDRAEGPSAECGERTFSTLDAAHGYLMRASATAPKGGGYDKVDAEIEWADGRSYGLRYDMVRDCADGNLARHMTQGIRFYSGRHCPSHMTAERYARFLNEFVPPDTRSYCAALLDGGYEGVS